MADSSTARRRYLGGELRKLREAKGVTAAEVAAVFEWSESKISRMENGRNAYRVMDVKLLLDHGANVNDVAPDGTSVRDGRVHRDSEKSFLIFSVTPCLRG